MKPRVVITHKVHQGTLDLLAPHCELVTNQSPDTLPRDEVLRRASTAEAMMAFMPDRVDRDFLEACPRLKIVGAALKGFDNFDAAACSERGVWLSFVPDLLTVPTAELTIGLTIGLTRQIRAADAFVRSGGFAGWQPAFYGLGMAGSRIGIVGMGAIGKAVAKRLVGWDAKLLYTDQGRLDTEEEDTLGAQWRDLEGLLGESDIVILALGLNETTLHVIRAERLRLMKAGAFLINPCRGSLVNEAAVLDALRKGHLGGYAADVFEMEDWARQDRPRCIDSALLAMPNTLFTAHIGSAVQTVRQAIERRAAENILDALAGRTPTDAVNSPSNHKETAC